MGEVEGLAWRMEETKMRGEGGKEREAEWTGRTRDPWEERRRERERERGANVEVSDSHHKHREVEVMREHC